MLPPSAKTKIDWLTFTFSVPPTPTDEPGMVVRIIETLRYRFQELPDFGGTVAQGIGNRAPYTKALMLAGVVVLYNPKLAWITVEITGSGCTRIGDEKLIALLRSEHNVLTRLTRLDLALDIETDVMPGEIGAAGYSPRFKAYRHWFEETGESYYVGAKESDRQCRVYRYADPHPRAHLLRFEYQLRRETAKATARHLLEYGIDNAIGALEHTFGWVHPLARFYNTGQRVTAWSEPNKSSVGTLRWLYRAVFPAIERLQILNQLPPDFWPQFRARFPQAVPGYATDPEYQRDPAIQAEIDSWQLDVTNWPRPDPALNE